MTAQRFLFTVRAEFSRENATAQEFCAAALKTSTNKGDFG
jgi:hypothetical protein